MSRKHINISKLAKKIQEIRRRARLNQQEFGRIIGCGPSNVSVIEAGLSRPSPSVIKNICREFGVSEKSLLNDDAELKMSKDQPIFALPDPRYQKIYDGLKKLLPSAEEKVINHLEVQIELLSRPFFKPRKKRRK